MPYARKRTTKKRARKPRRRTRRAKAKRSDYSYAKLKTIGVPYNLYTFARLTSPTTFWQIPMPSSTGTPPLNSYTYPNFNSYAFAHNFLAPWNMAWTLPGVQPLPVPDQQFFGPAITPSTFNTTPPVNGLYIWSGLTWWANFFQKCRISHVWLKYTIRPTQLASTLTAGVDSSRLPFSITILEGKYIPGVMSPEVLNTIDYDDLRATKGAKTFTVSGQANKPLILKRKISVKKLLGIKDLADITDSECVISTTLTTAASAARAFRNPANTNATFTYLRISRGGPPGVPLSEVFTYSMQVDAVAKIHLYQLQPNCPLSLVGNNEIDDPQEFPDAPGGAGSSSS